MDPGVYIYIEVENFVSYPHLYTDSTFDYPTNMEKQEDIRDRIEKAEDPVDSHQDWTPEEERSLV
jgi:hypothetical protein